MGVFLNIQIYYYSLIHFSSLIILLFIVIYVLSLKNKNTVTWLFAIWFFLNIPFSLGFMISNSLILGEFVKISTYLRFSGIFAFLAFMAFAYNFPKNIHPRESRIVLPLALIASIASTFYSISIYDLKGWYFEFDVHFLHGVDRVHAVKSWGLVFLLFGLWILVLLIRKTMAFSGYDGRLKGLLQKPARRLSLTGLKHYIAKFLSGFTRFFRPEGKNARSIRSFTWAWFIAFLGSLSYTLVNRGIISYTVYILFLMNILMTLYFVFAIIYINNTLQPTSFMFKLIGIPLVTLLIIISGISTISFRENEKHYSYDDFEKLELIKDDISSGRPIILPNGVKYVALRNGKGLYADSFKILAGDKTITPRKLLLGNKLMKEIDIRDRLRRMGVDPVNPKGEAGRLAVRKVTEEIENASVRLMAKRYFYWDVNNEDAFYSFYSFALNNQVYDVGFSYRDYRKTVNDVVIKYILLIVVSVLAIVIFFPLFFWSNMISPLKELLNGVKEVNEGNLDVIVSVSVEDEIGFLSHSFNGMVASIKRSSIKLNYEVDERRKAEDEVHKKNIEVESTNEDLQATLEELESTNEEFEAQNMELIIFQKELQDSEERFRSLVETTSDWIWEVDREGIYRYCGPKVVDILGYAPEELVGIKTPFDFMPREVAKEVGLIFKEFTASAKPVESLEKVSIHKDGHEVVIETSGVPIFNDSGELTGYRGINRDVTDRKKSQEIIIQNEKLRSVGGLAAGMAHEINNPLAGILQSAQVIKERLTGKLLKNKSVAKESGTDIDTIGKYLEKRGILRMLETIMDSGKRAAEIVENMLNFSRMEDPRFERHDLAKLLDKTMELALSDFNLKEKYDFKDIEVVREYAGDLDDILCDGPRMQQVFLNIFKNGADAMIRSDMKDRKPKLTLRTRLEGDHAFIEIEDNGPGISEEVKSRIFEPFYTTKSVGEGTGLGLSISYFIVCENHNGEMFVESKPGKGTKLIISLPVKVG